MRDIHRPRRRGGRERAGVALLMVISAITILALVLVQFSAQTRTHLMAGVNMRDELTATTVADTAIALTRACLDPQALLGGQNNPLAAIASQQLKNVDPEKMCNLLLGLFVSSRLDLPIGGLSFEVKDVQGLGIQGAEIEELSLTSEASFLALNALRCPPNQAAPGEPSLNCPEQTLVVSVLRAMMCDRRLDPVFEFEQADGRKYTRGEIIANLIDWVDADDQRTRIDEDLNWQITFDAGESEDGYFRSRVRGSEPKNAPFDSTEELRLLPGMNSQLYEFLKPRISVHASGKLNANHVSEELLADMLWAKDPLNALQKSGCEGLRTQSLDPDDDADPEKQGGQTRALYRVIAKLFVKARQIRELQALMGLPIKSSQHFEQIARDPLNYICTNDPRLTLAAAGAPITPQQIDLCKAQTLGPLLPEGTTWTIDNYNQVMASVSQTLRLLSRDLEFQSPVLRLQVKAKAGNLTKRVMAVLRRGGVTSDSAADKTRRANPNLTNPPANPNLPTNLAEAAQAAGRAQLDEATGQNAVRIVYYREY
ncbi:MAG: general secretion pathway protein GspK [Myxococcales bacterium]|nr:general secretion pathway protein GspK [Myxococcales bacterium]